MEETATFESDAIIAASELYFILEAFHKHVNLMREYQTLYFTSKGRTDVDLNARNSYLVNSKVQEKIVDKLKLKIGVFFSQVAPPDQQTYFNMLNKNHDYQYFKITD